MTLVGCSEVVENNDDADTDFAYIGDSRLSYDKTTGIIYNNNLVYGGTVYTIYYSENGKICKYVDGHIVELETDDNETESSENTVVVTNEKDKNYNTSVDKSEDYTDNSGEYIESSPLYWNTDLKSVFTENYAEEHSKDIDDAYSVRIYYDVDEKYHACGSMVFGKSDTYSEHEFDSTGKCNYCGYIKEENRND